jgi:PKD repeat protein
MKRFFILICFFSTFTTLYAQFQVNEYNKATQELNRRGEVYFSFQLTDLSQLSLLTKLISISDVKDNTIYAYANQKEFNEFINYNFNYKVHTAPSELFQVQMSDNPKQVLTWNYYPTYPAYETIMEQFASDHPDICNLLTITTLASGRKILGLRISDNVNLQENEPEFLYTSSIHGDETTGYILMLHLADYLLTGYGSDSRITNMVNNFDIVICPLTNPDGTYKGGNNTVNGATRGNANNIDCNRNYPDPKGGPHPDGNAWQPETVAFMNFAGFNTFTMGANFHGGTEVLNYPWDTWSRVTADDAWWIYTSREYADTVHQNAPSNYFNQYNNGITNGNAWYEIEGGRQDYMNFFRHCRESTLEISDTKLIPESQLIAHWNYNYRSLLNYIEQAGYGLHGLVTDSMSGEPLNAKIYISGFDMDSSHIYTDPQVGDYHRLLKGGSYNVTYSAAGYFPKTFTVQVTDHQTTNLDVQLYDGRLETSFNADTTIVAVDQQIQFHDLSAGNPITWTWTFDGATPASSNEMNPVVSYSEPGMYPVKLVVTRTGVADSLVRNDYIEVKPWYIMGNKTYTLCDASFFDAGGPNAQYSDNESSILTFLPSEVTEKLTAVFNNLDIEDGGVDCINDKLMIYDGITTNDNLIATICGKSLPDRITATNPSGALTFRFQSNQAISGSGWDITLSCDSNVGIIEKTEYAIRIYPNPVSHGMLTIDSEQPVQYLIIRDITGRVMTIKEPFTNKTTVECTWPSGIYFLQIQIQGKWINRKIQVLK